MSAPGLVERFKICIGRGRRCCLRYPDEHCRVAFGMELGINGKWKARFISMRYGRTFVHSPKFPRCQPSARKCSSQTPTPR